ncbi:MAG TPA: TonB-dependent receptor, partial [Gemmatimonadaceae bacterium]|nr:TonB-dependent receptor [Gemmatimonadaceae bacterium]
GVVTSLPTHQPLVGASVEIAGANRRTRTDSSGNFRVAYLPAGNVTVQVRVIGYEAMAATVSLADDSTVRLDFAIRLVVELPPVTVESPTLGARDGRLRGFYERRAAGFGRFVTREDIEKRDPGDSRDLLRGMPGVRVVGNRIQMASGMSSPNCRVQYFLDGIHIPAPAADFLVQFRPRDLEGLEVYRGPAEAPAAFSRGGAECGVIAIWTRTPGGRK